MLFSVARNRLQSMNVTFSFAATMLVVAALPVNAAPPDKASLLSKYRDKFVVVTNEGLSTCYLSAEINGGIGDLIVFINGPNIQDVHARAIFCSAEPVHKGEVFAISHVAFHSGHLFLSVLNVSPHAITRGLGAFAHESLESGKATVRIPAGSDGKDMDAADSLAAHWFKLFDTAADAAKIGNTATGAFVAQVKAGMSFADVESALGVPQTRIDLNEKILYKYKDMTVEFHNGKVTDVR